MQRDRISKPVCWNRDVLFVTERYLLRKPPLEQQRYHARNATEATFTETTVTLQLRKIISI